MKLKKYLSVFSTGCLLTISTIAFGQNGGGDNLPSNTSAFGKGTNVLSLGVGLGGEYTYIGSGYTSTPNFVISYDNGTFDHVGPGIISLGGLLSYKGVSYDYNSAYYYNNNYYYNNSWTYFILGFRSAYHWNFTSSSKFDPYIGLMLAYNYVSYKETSNDPYYNNPQDPYYYSGTYASYLNFSLYLGARYYLSNSVGIWLELGTGYSNAALGVSFKF